MKQLPLSDPPPEFAYEEWRQFADFATVAFSRWYYLTKLQKSDRIPRVCWSTYACVCVFVCFHLEFVANNRQWRRNFQILQHFSMRRETVVRCVLSARRRMCVLNICLRIRTKSLLLDCFVITVSLWCIVLFVKYVLMADSPHSKVICNCFHSDQIKWCMRLITY